MQQLTLPLLIVWAEKYTPPLLGRAWMTKIWLDWKNLFSPSNGQFVVERDNDQRIISLKKHYVEIFKPELGTVKGVISKLHFRNNVKPVFQKPCPVPYALHPKELKKMEDEGIIEPHPLSVYLRRMAWYAYVATLRGLSTCLSNGAVSYSDIRGDLGKCLPGKSSETPCPRPFVGRHSSGQWC